MTSRPARLLVSVRNCDETSMAIDGGADLIDIKDPDRGSLGMAPLRTVRAIVRLVARRRPVSMALGEWHEAPAVVPHGIELVKVGLARAPRDWKHRLAHQLTAHLPAGLVAVAYADHQLVASPPPWQVLAWALRHGAAGLLIDTAVKDGQDLFAWLDEQTLGDAVSRARRAGLMVALAGSLKIHSLRRALRLRPHVVAVRGSACSANDRASTIDADRVRALADIIAAHNARKEVRTEVKREAESEIGADPGAG